MAVNPEWYTNAIKKGFKAAMEGRTIDNCRYKLEHKRQAWLQGFRQGREERIKRSTAVATQNLTDQQRQQIHQHTNQLREILQIQKKER